MSIQNIDRNKWRVVVKSKEKDPKTGKNKYLNRIFRGTKEEARAFEIQLSSTPVSTMTLGSYLNDVWLPSIKVEEGTRYKYTYGIQKLEPLYKIELAKLTAVDLELAIHALPEGEIRRMARLAVNVALNAAVRRDLIPYNPMDKAVIKYGSGKKREFEAYNSEELATLLEYLKGKVAEATVIIMSHAGLSREEALALDWEDISFDNPKEGMAAITISKAWTTGGKTTELKAPKTTARIRTVYIGNYGYQRLKELAKDKSGAIWPGLSQKYVRPDAASRNFKRLAQFSGVRYIPLNYLRHTHATLSLANGVDVSIVSKNLGHSKISTTVDHYVKPMEEARIEAAITFGELISMRKPEVDE